METSSRPRVVCHVGQQFITEDDVYNERRQVLLMALERAWEMRWDHGRDMERPEPLLARNNRISCNEYKTSPKLRRRNFGIESGGYKVFSLANDFDFSYHCYFIQNSYLL